MKLNDIIEKHLDKKEVQLLFGAFSDYSRIFTRNPSAGFNLLITCKDSELDSISRSELVCLSYNLHNCTPELNDPKYKAMVSEIQKEVCQALNKMYSAEKASPK